MNTRAKGEGRDPGPHHVRRRGNLGDPDAAKRQTAVENHYKWVDAAKTLGCHTIRVNGYSSGTPDEQMKLVADGMRKLCEYADGHGINVVIENHGGLSSNGKWLVRNDQARRTTSAPARCPTSATSASPAQAGTIPTPRSRATTRMSAWRK